MGALVDRLLGFSFRNRTAVLGAVLVLIVAGLQAFATLTPDAFPDLTPNQVLVMTEAPGLSPVEVEQLVAFPIETAMLGLPRMERGRRSPFRLGPGWPAWPRMEGSARSPRRRCPW